MEDSVTLVSSDGHKFVVSKDAAMKSSALAGMLETMEMAGESAELPVAKVEGVILGIY
jgi:hypothetical protein